MSIILLPENLREKLGDPAAKELIDLINNTAKQTKNDVLETSEDKFEKRLSNCKAEIIKWMFIFGVVQVTATAIIAILIIK